MIVRHCTIAAIIGPRPVRALQQLRRLRITRKVSGKFGRSRNIVIICQLSKSLVCFCRLADTMVLHRVEKDALTG